MNALAEIAWSPGTSPRMRAYALEAAQRQNAKKTKKGMGDYASDSAQLSALQNGFNQANASGDAASAQGYLSQYQAIAASYPGTFDDNIAYMQSLLAGGTGSSATANTAGGIVYQDSTGAIVDPSTPGAVPVSPGQSYASSQALLQQAITNQPGLWDQLVAAAPSTPLSVLCTPCAVLPNWTVGQAVTVLGGYASALGLPGASPQSGADFQAQTNAQANINAAKKKACVAAGGTWNDATNACSGITTKIKYALIGLGVAAALLGGGYVVLKNYALGRGLRANRPRRAVRRPNHHRRAS